MFRSRRSSRLAWRASGVVALAAAGLMATGAAASAGTGPLVPQTFTPSHSAAPTRTVQWPIACDFSSYGYHTGSPAPYDYTLTLPRTVTAGTPATASLASPAIALPASVAAQLKGADSFTLSAAGKRGSYVSGSSAKTIDFTGTAQSPTAVLTRIPAITAVGSVTFGKAGTAEATNPVGFVITPAAGGKALAPITCDSPIAGITSYPITVTAPATTPAPPAANGPVYSCQFLVNGKGDGSLPAAPLPMTLSASGNQATGSTDTVTLSSGTAGLGAPYPHGTVGVGFAGALAVTGAQHGTILLSRETTQVGSMFRVSGSLPLTAPGTDRVWFPAKFVFTVFGPKNPATGKPITLVLACTSKSGVVGLWLHVTGKPVPAPVPVGGGTAANGAVPAGAPNTGGGARPGSDLPLAAGGAVVLLAGLTGLGYAVRRRRQGQPSI